MALGTRYHGIRSVEDARGRCRIVEGKHGEVHWVWAGAVTALGIIRMWAPSYAHGGAMNAQNGRHAMWQLAHKAPIPDGHKVFRTCKEPLCINPAHMVCRTPKEHGQWMAAEGRLKGLPSKIAANRRTLLARSNVTPELYQTIITSDKTGRDLVAETGIGRSTISRIRTGQFSSITPLASVFSGLLEAKRA